VRGGLRYFWQLVAAFPGGPCTRIAVRSIFQAYKPVLVFQKPPLRPAPEWGPDLIAVPVRDQDKPLHPWQQSETLFRKLVERFTHPGDLVVDPFAGSGTTLRAALALSRHAWGADDGSADRA
jgi:DNA modification methylase